MIILATILSGLSLLLSVLFLPQLKVINTVFMIRVTAAALSPYWAILGVFGALIGWVYKAFWAVPMGIIGAGMVVCYVWQCTRDHKGFEDAFGPGWEDKISLKQAKLIVRRRWSPFLKMKASPEPLLERDIAFWTVPDSERELLCDIWRPSGGQVSGLAVVYVHGGGWVAGDKDFMTRPFFRHLVSQGHTVMDVAYRLCPEVELYGIVGDVKHAISWMKAKASHYGVNPRKIVLVGSSAGAHITLLAAHTAGHPSLTPENLKDTDLSVCGVISYYGPTNLAAGYEPWLNSNPYINMDPVPIGTELDPKKAMNYSGRLDIVLGGHPQDIPDRYRLANPITHIHPDSPPTLLIQGDKDILVSLDTTNAFHAKLVESDVPAINVVFPWTDHMFDLILPQINPAAQSALYDVDRFLALLLSMEEKQHTTHIPAF
jgi:acetyl esterase/lipase